MCNDCCSTPSSQSLPMRAVYAGVRALALRSIALAYCVPAPNSRGVRIRSGAKVLWFQGPTFNCGLGGSDLI